MGLLDIELDSKGLITGAVITAGALWFLKREVQAIAPDAIKAIDPVNPDNVFNRGFKRVFQTVTGRPDDFGSWLYEKLH